jgi:histidine decarboxylase
MSSDNAFGLREVVNGAVGNFPTNCMGYMNPGASGSGYIATMKLSVDSIPMDGLDPGAGGIVSYDRCEKDDAYIGQINMGTASSFCGVNGALWGYDLAVAPEIKNGTLEPMFTYPGPDYPPGEKLPSQGRVPVYPVAPLLDAAERLFGRMDSDGDGEIDRRRFPPLPGAHVICANKSASQIGPGFFWSILGIAIAEDRETQSNLFIEDCGVDMDSANPAQAKDALYTHFAAVAKSMVLCGQDQGVTYTSAFIGGKFIDVKEDEWGCSLACAPYIVLAQDAVAQLGEPAQLIDMTIGEWEESAGLEPLPPSPRDPRAGGIGVPGAERL